MDSLAIVKEFNVIKQVGVDFIKITVLSVIDSFFLQLRQKTLDTGVVVGASAVADFPEFKIWRTVRSLISSLYFELLLGIVPHLLGVCTHMIS